MNIQLLKNSLFVFFLFLLLSFPAFAQGDLMIMPKRLVFDGTQRSQEINLANTGSEPATYAVSFVNYNMTEEGDFEQIEEPEEGQRFAENFLRYFPRRITLPPNEAQTIRVQLTRTGNLEQGEYRSHMYFRAVEDETALTSEEADEADGISINIKTVFGISIPVIIRHGESTTEIELTEIAVNRDQEEPMLSLVLNRTGNMSVYGNLKVNHISPGGVTTEVGLVKGLSVYTPNSKRYFSMALRNLEEINLSEGKLKVTYTSDSGEVLASSEL